MNYFINASVGSTVEVSGSQHADFPLVGKSQVLNNLYVKSPREING